MDVPFWKSTQEGADPLADACFAGIDFLPATNEADDNSPIIMPVQAGNQEFRFGLGEARAVVSLLTPPAIWAAGLKLLPTE